MDDKDEIVKVLQVILFLVDKMTPEEIEKLGIEKKYIKTGQLLFNTIKIYKIKDE
jgi:hypothetical protein